MDTGLHANRDSNRRSVLPTVIDPSRQKAESSDVNSQKAIRLFQFPSITPNHSQHIIHSFATDEQGFVSDDVTGASCAHP
jgi:hypothetical protein